MVARWAPLVPESDWKIVLTVSVWKPMGMRSRSMPAQRRSGLLIDLSQSPEKCHALIVKKIKKLNTGSHNQKKTTRAVRAR